MEEGGACMFRLGIFLENRCKNCGERLNREMQCTVCGYDNTKHYKKSLKKQIIEVLVVIFILLVIVPILFTMFTEIGEKNTRDTEHTMKTTYDKLIEDKRGLK